MYDLLITGGPVIDGAGNPWQCADVAVQGERIAAVGPLKDAAAREQPTRRSYAGPCVALALRPES